MGEWVGGWVGGCGCGWVGENGGGVRQWVGGSGLNAYVNVGGWKNIFFFKRCYPPAPTQKKHSSIIFFTSRRYSHFFISCSMTFLIHQFILIRKRLVFSVVLDIFRYVHLHPPVPFQRDGEL